jgi:AraC-like DNA-binding protein
MGQLSMKTDRDHSRIERDYAFTRMGFQVLDKHGRDIMKIAEKELFSVSRVAEELGLTIHQFKAVFERTVGLCPKEFFRHYRAVMARRMIGESMPLLEISEKLGFRYYTHFAGEIRSFYGISPRDLQKIVHPSNASAEQPVRGYKYPRNAGSKIALNRLTMGSAKEVLASRSSSLFG